MATSDKQMSWAFWLLALSLPHSLLSPVPCLSSLFVLVLTTATLTFGVSITLRRRCGNTVHVATALLRAGKAAPISGGLLGAVIHHASHVGDVDDAGALAQEHRTVDSPSHRAPGHCIGQR